MNAKYFVTNLQPIRRNKEWIQAPYVSRAVKARYYPDMFISYSRLALSGKKYVDYLGARFSFDNPAAPLNLQGYPFEIGNKILNNMDITPKFILDIGANIGQFCCTFASILPETRIDSFEPNPDIFSILKGNIVKKERIKAYNYGLSTASAVEMFYEPEKSATGSLFEVNAGRQENMKKVSIMTIHDVSVLTKRKRYDLVKIDVEGYEYNVLECLRNIQTKYLFIELSGEARAKDYTHSDIFKRIEEVFGSFDICFASEHTKSKPTFDVLLKIK